MSDPQQPAAPPEIQAGVLTKGLVSLDDARRRREEAIERGETPQAEMGLLAGPKGVPDATEAPAAAAEAPPEPEAKPTALADQLVMFCSADGLRRCEMVTQPFLPPPPIIELECRGLEKVIALPGESSSVNRRYAFRGSVTIPPLGLMVHHYQEC